MCPRRDNGFGRLHVVGNAVYKGLHLLGSDAWSIKYRSTETRHATSNDETLLLSHQ